MALADEETIDQILLQLQEYIQEVDVEFVRLCVRAIGRLAIWIESAADKSLNALVQAMDQQNPLIIQESILVLKDVFRKYPS